MNTTLPHTQMANAIRALAMDAVQKANSGHPGMPMGMAEIAVALWSGHYSHNPANPKWANRDCFLLSNGHGSMLHYALLHLTGYAVTMDDIQSFRQMHSKTPGHPEVDVTPGVETTTGPLGQGLASAQASSRESTAPVLPVTRPTTGGCASTPVSSASSGRRAPDAPTRATPSTCSSAASSPSRVMSV